VNKRCANCSRQQKVTEQKQLDVLRRLDSVFFQRLVDDLIPLQRLPFFGAHWAAHLATADFAGGSNGAGNRSSGLYESDLATMSDAGRCHPFQTRSITPEHLHRPRRVADGYRYLKNLPVLLPPKVPATQGLTPGSPFRWMAGLRILGVSRPRS